MDVKQKSLKSCEKCDFDTEDKEELEAHQVRNVHNVKDRENLELNVILQRCGFCDYTSEDQKNVNEHAYQSHGLITCEKCEYGALDADIMKKHMKTHTGRIIFTCRVCEFEATRQGMLDDHMESKHTKKDHPPEKHDCKKCEQTFPTSLHLEFHICKPA